MSDQFRQIDLKSISQAISLLLAAAYLFGFISVNAHLSGLGVTDFEAVNLRYVPAGLLIIGIGAVFYFTTARHIVRAREYLANGLSVVTGRPGFAVVAWGLFCWLALFVQLTFQIVFTAAFLSLVLFGESAPLFFGFLLLLFLVDYFFDFTNLDIRYPLLIRPLQALMHGAAIYWFFQTLAGPSALELAAIFAVHGVFINLLMDTRERWKVDASKNLYDAFWVFLMLCIFANIYGGKFYERTRSAFGGGQPQNVALLVDPNIRDRVSPPLTLDDGWIKARLISKVGNEYILAPDTHEIVSVLRVRGEAVSVLKTLPGAPASTASPKAGE